MSFEDLLNQTVTLYAPGGTNKYGRKTDGVGTNHPARVDLRTRTRHDQNGNLVTMAGQISLLPGTDVFQGQRVDYLGQQYEITHHYPVPGGDGVTHHIEADIVENRG